MLDSRRQVEGKREDTGVKGKMPLRRFIDSGQSTGYVITEMPGPMFKDVDVPKCVRCGNLLEKCVEVNYWMSEVQGLRHHFAPFLAHFSAPLHPTRAV